MNQRGSSRFCPAWTCTSRCRACRALRFQRCAEATPVQASALRLQRCREYHRGVRRGFEMCEARPRRLRSVDVCPIRQNASNGPPQGLDLTGAQFAGIREYAAAPTERLAAEPLDQKVGHQARDAHCRSERDEWRSTGDAASRQFHPADRFRARPNSAHRRKASRCRAGCDKRRPRYSAPSCGKSPPISTHRRTCACAASGRSRC